ncbi:hypothetical protein ILYODFUR_010159 [Ilyodon furcidens]|uniref:G protein-regulated inducer of neurite outgrowth C-terminal domain-containing protein n=1 Tax=Ilyodon furcidens TaxID=33524 RepID=A0ABV0V5G7_9TELE
MSTPTNITKRRKDVLQLECDVSVEVDPSNSLVNTDPNATWGTEPNFNLNLNLSSLSNPHPTKETSKMHSGSKKEEKSKRGGNPGDKRAVAVDFNTISLPDEKLRSKIPTISSSPTAQMTVQNKSDQQLKSPNIKHSSTPEIQMHDKSVLSPKPKGVKLNSSQRSTEKVKTETPKAESAAALTPKPTTNSANNVSPNLKVQSNRKDEGGNEIHHETPSKTLKLPKSPKGPIQKGDKSSISPRPTNRTPTMMTKTKKTDPNPVNLITASDQNTGDDSRSQGVFITPGTSQKEKTESALLRTKPPQVTSQSSSTQRKTTRTRNSILSGSKENLHVKDFNVASGSKITLKSGAKSKATKGSIDSLDSKASSKSRSHTGSKDALDCKSSSASKSSLDSRESLDFKTLQSSKARPKFRIGSRDIHDPKAPTETRMKKSHRSSEEIADSKTVPGSNNNHDSKLLQNSEASFDPKIKTASGSDSKPGITQSSSPATLQASAFNMDLLGRVSLSSTSSRSIQTAGSTVGPSLNPKNQFDLSRSGQVWSGSKSTLTDLSSALRHSPVSTSPNPGSSTGKGFASTLTGSNGENQKSPSSSPGILAPLASSSPKARPMVTSKMLDGFAFTSEASTVMKRNPGSSSQNTSLTRGLTFDSITKPGTNADKEHSKVAESKVNTQGGLGESPEAKNDGDGCLSGDDRRKSDILLTKAGHPGETNIISSPWASREPKQKMQVRGKKNEANPSSPLHPLSSSSTHTPTKKKVKEIAAKTKLAQRLHKHPGKQNEVGIQVEVEVVERSTSTSPSLQWGPPTSSLIGSPSCLSSLSCNPPLKHVCQIEIELCSQTMLPYDIPDKASSLPACLHTYSLQQNPTLILELGQNHNPDVSTDSIREDENEDEEKRQPNKAEEDGFEGKTEKPQEVLWDKQGMTWEVYGASVDLESLGTTIQSHLEMKIREQERRIWILRKSICSNSSFTRYKLKKRRRRFLGCCIKASTVAD